MNFFTQIFLSKRQSVIICRGIIIFFLSYVPLNAQWIETTRDLSFGTFSTGDGGTVSISSSDVRTATGSVDLFPSDNGNTAMIRVYFFDNYTYSLTAYNIVDLTNGSGGSMTLEIIDWNPSTPYHAWWSGWRNFNIGGKLTVGPPAVTSAGNYSGSFNIQFNWN